MRIAFYAPMKAPDHPTPSGDRLIGRLLIAALERQGHEVRLACRLRTWDRMGDQARQGRLKTLGERIADRLIRRWQRQPGKCPQAWFTYHLYHKAPDWIGPRVAAALGIPYIIAEASVAGKQRQGRWALGYQGGLAALGAADLVISLNPADLAGIEPHLAPGCARLTLLPFIDMAPFRALDGQKAALRQDYSTSHTVPGDVPWMIAVGMLRPGDKQRSFEILAKALGKIAALPWHLIVIGDGPARAELQSDFGGLAERITWLGQQEASAVARWLTASDLCVWPAVNEAFGMALLEAQAAGLPVVAGDVGGVSAIVRQGVTGTLVPMGDIDSFAAATADFLHDGDRRRAVALQARAIARAEHDLATASEHLNAAIRKIVS
jgi:glycosyltransferase involved in cell wall biosynthesis